MRANRSARVEHFAAFAYDGVITDRRAVLACGCCIFLGESDGMLTTVSRQCCEPHLRIVNRAQELLGSSVDDDTATAALSEATREIRPSTAEES